MSTIINNKDVQTLNDIESDNCSSLSNAMNDNLNDIESGNSLLNAINNDNQIITFRYSSNKLLYILLISLGTLIAVLCISLQTTMIHTNQSEFRFKSNDKSITRQLLMSTSSASREDDPNSDAFKRFKQILKDINDHPDSETHKRWDKVLGLLIGSAIGDSLGSVLEFWFDYLGEKDFPLEPKTLGRLIGDTLYQVQKSDGIDPEKIYQNEVVPAAMKMQGGGWNRFEPGATTDDTAMSMQLARALIMSHDQKPESGEDVEISVKTIQENILVKYREWANPNPEGNIDEKTKLPIRQTPFDIGITTREIFTSGITDLDSILEMTKQKNEDVKELYGNGVWSNGALMRCYPLAIYCLHLSFDDCFNVVAADVALTNNNPTVKTVVATYVLITRELLNGIDATQARINVENWLKERKDAIDYMGYKNSQKKELGFTEQQPSQKTLEWITKALRKPVKASGEGPIGIMTVGFEKSIYYLPRSGISFEQVMTAIFKEKGDTDTNGAIVGGILGARDGISKLFEQYPNWIKKILECTVDKHPKPLRPNVHIAGKIITDFVDADFNPYLAKHYIEDNIWEKLIDAAPQSVVE